MLFTADILLHDEPTNHLDVVNIAWLETYLTSLKHCTSIIVSHDSSFLNNTITNVLHLKLLQGSQIPQQSRELHQARTRGKVLLYPSGSG
jgi:ATPase subunit of ABC transporter with duplicated ATPase domains